MMIKQPRFLEILDYFRMQPKNHEATAAEIYAYLSRNGALTFDQDVLEDVLGEMCVNPNSLDLNPAGNIAGIVLPITGKEFSSSDDFTFLVAIDGYQEWHYRLWDIWWDYLNQYRQYHRDTSKAEVLRQLEMLIPKNIPVDMGYKLSCPDSDDNYTYEYGTIRIEFGRTNLPLQKSEHELLDDCYEAVRSFCSSCDDNKYCDGCDLHESMKAAKKWFGPKNTQTMAEQPGDAE